MRLDWRLVRWLWKWRKAMRGTCCVMLWRDTAHPYWFWVATGTELSKGTYVFSVHCLTLQTLFLFLILLHLQSGFRKCEWPLCSSCSLFRHDCQEAQDQKLIKPFQITHPSHLHWDHPSSEEMYHAKLSSQVFFLFLFLLRVTTHFIISHNFINAMFRNVKTICLLKNMFFFWQFSKYLWNLIIRIRMITENYWIIKDKKKKVSTAKKKDTKSNC